MFTYLTLLFYAAIVSAHTIFQELYVNGVDQGHETGIRVPDYDGPITDVTSNDIICNGGINPYHQPIDPADPVDPSHKGPILAYLAQVPNATQSTVTGLQWYKIYEDGYSNGVWAVDTLIANKGKVSFTIPSCVAAGQYLLRVELIALHAASSYPGAQFYMECAQLQITGGGSASPATVSFPGAYKGTDPGIKINIYEPLSNYTIPGPSVFSCSGSSNTPVPSSAPASSATGEAASTTSAVIATPTSGATVAQYGQCGGSSYTGPTICASPFTCQNLNDYYSQCL
ncbi:uncharacterized protein BT62DRAFT_982159 [Guyanagaster necrorhizus]|uniref:AA9 family lytic polysaccharide monooxygenase n=1 Tax=Guyanagaster necrorhizus TaxID=856835 RepID=A0A9P8APH5_9AGAR|nr:uncharacterized protein BT62DRAFT_982159 [Guyanagaster necrorhizus MCA 3950]KAG7442955.1 hypothetical protein BT62DRAFT_982159 [Guyanagaster necrorhizus MCA 3950]